jgi:hypothetical protein
MAPGRHRHQRREVGVNLGRHPGPDRGSGPV